MKLDELVRDMPVLSASGSLDREVTGVVCDSRQVRPGYCFVAVSGTDKDGWNYGVEAVQRGAAAIVSEHDESLAGETTRLRVVDARTALADLSCRFHRQPSLQLRMVGITGTNGKTTTAYLVRQILAAAGLRPGLLTTVEYQVGERTIPASRTTPEAPVLQSLLAQMVASGCRSAVMEASSHALDQKRTGGIAFDAAVFTNLTRDHLDYHRTLENYFEAKRRLFTDLGRQGKPAWAIVNQDDPWGRKLLQTPRIRAEIVTYGLEAAARVRAEDIRADDGGTSFQLVSPWGRAALRTPLMGRFNVSNVLAAAAACGSLGIGVDVIAAAVPALAAVPGRLERIPTDKGFKVFVDYAHTDDALENVLKTLREITGKRLIVVFGCGGSRDTSKRPLMGRVVSQRADAFIITSDNPRKEKPADIMAQIRAGVDPSASFEMIEDRAEAIRRAVEWARPGDVVLIAGKGHENFQEFENTTIPFDDRQVVKRYV